MPLTSSSAKGPPVCPVAKVTNHVGIGDAVAAFEVWPPHAVQNLTPSARPDPHFSQKVTLHLAWIYDVAIILHTHAKMRGGRDGEPWRVSEEPRAVGTSGVWHDYRARRALAWRITSPNAASTAGASFFIDSDRQAYQLARRICRPDAKWRSSPPAFLHRLAGAKPGLNLG